MTWRGRLVKHLRSYLTEEDARNVLIYYQKQLAAFVHAQMQIHHWEKPPAMMWSSAGDLRI
jgi:type III restriction enzyme